MDIWKKLKGELIDIVEWLDNTPDTLVYRFERHNNEIKNNAKLVVRESQAAVFVREGTFADTFNPGMYTLDTRNLPILSTILGWKYGFESPFKAEVYFVNTRNFTDRKWGTMNPIMLRDPEYGPVRLRAFGTYAFRVADPTTFLKQVVGTNPRFTTDGISEQLRNYIVSEFADTLGEAKIPVLDLAANYTELGTFIRDKIAPHIAQLGLELSAFSVENISLPPEVEKALDQRTSMGIVGDMNRYTQFNAAQALGQSGNTPNSAIGTGVGLGAGMAMAQQMASALQPGAAAPPPIPGAAQALAFFIAQNNQQAGPFDAATLARLASEGKLTRETLVWRQGMPAWAQAATVAELAQVFGAVPPPLPPQA